MISLSAECFDTSYFTQHHLIKALSQKIAVWSIQFHIAIIRLNEYRRQKATGRTGNHDKISNPLKIKKEINYFEIILSRSRIRPDKWLTFSFSVNLS